MDPVLDKAIQDLLQIKAIRVVPRDTNVFLSRVFTVPKNKCLLVTQGFRKNVLPETGQIMTLVLVLNVFSESNNNINKNNIGFISLMIWHIYIRKYNNKQSAVSSKQILLCPIIHLQECKVRRFQSASLFRMLVR